jgi:putative transposase
VIPQVPHHVVQKGNQGQEVFRSDEDCVRYVTLLRKQCERAGLTVQGYCLMPNHVHLVVTPSTEGSLSSAVGQAHRLYARRLNFGAERTGHVWEGRFYSCPLDEAHFIRALVYVDRNPVRAGLVRKPWEWRWSSATAHLGKYDPAGLVDPDEWAVLSERMGWREIVQQEEDGAVLEGLRHHTRTGRPLGGEDFLGKIEERLGYPVMRGRPGRPRVTRK